MTFPLPRDTFLSTKCWRLVHQVLAFWSWWNLERSPYLASKVTGTRGKSFWCFCSCHIKWRVVRWFFSLAEQLKNKQVIRLRCLKKATFGPDFSLYQDVIDLQKLVSVDIGKKIPHLSCHNLCKSKMYQVHMYSLYSLLNLISQCHEAFHVKIMKIVP